METENQNSIEASQPKNGKNVSKNAISKNIALFVTFLPFSLAGVPLLNFGFQFSLS